MQNQTLTVRIGHNVFDIEHQTMMGNLNEFWECGNAYRIQKGLPPKLLDNWLRSADTAEYIAEVEKKLLGKSITSNSVGNTELEISDYKGKIVSVTKTSPLFKTRRGRYGGTWAHLYILIDAATYLDPAFKLAVYETFIEGKLLQRRDEGGENFKAVNIAIDAYLPDREGKDNKFLYINLANLIADKFGLPEVEKGKNRWNDATLHQTEARAKIEETLTIMLRTGLVKDWDHLKTLVAAL